MADQPPYTSPAEVLALAQSVIKSQVPWIRNYLIGFAGVIPEKAPANKNLGSPSSPTIYIGGAGTYVTPSGTLVTTSNLNFFFWKGISWTLLEVPVTIDLTEYAKKVDTDPLVNAIDVDTIGGITTVSVNHFVATGTLSLKSNVDLIEVDGIDWAIVDGNGNLLEWILNGIRYPIPAKSFYQNGYSRVNQKIISAQTIKVGLFGDSQTYSKGNTNGAQSTSPIHTVLSTILNQIGIAATVINKGIDGATSAQVLSAMKTDPDFSTYDVVYIQGGGNDALSNVPIATYKNNILSASKYAMDNGALTLNWFNPNAKNLPSSKNRQLYKSAMFEAAKEVNAIFIDTSPQIEKLYNGNYWIGDGLHLQPKAYAAEAMQFAWYLAYMQVSNKTVNPGDRYNMFNGFFSSPNESPFDWDYSNTGNGLIIRSAAPFKTYAAFYLTSKQQMQVKEATDMAKSRTLTFRLGDGSIQDDITATLTNSTGNNPPSPNLITLFTLERGYHIISISATVDIVLTEVLFNNI